MDKNNIDYIENKCTKMEYQKYFLKMLLPGLNIMIYQKLI